MEPEELEATIARPEQLRRPHNEEAAGYESADDSRSRLEHLASNIGNRGFARALSRMRDGEGILTGGLVHPDVEAAIASVQGSGRALHSGVAARAGAQLGGSFDDVRVHTDDHAAALSRAVSARAFTVGNDIFFGSGEYKPTTSAGQELLTHELTHVAQQRGAPASGPLLVSQPGDPLEREAESAARGG